MSDETTSTTEEAADEQRALLERVQTDADEAGGIDSEELTEDERETLRRLTE